MSNQQSFVAVFILSLVICPAAVIMNQRQHLTYSKHGFVSLHFSINLKLELKTNEAEVCEKFKSSKHRLKIYWFLHK